MVKSCCEELHVLKESPDEIREIFFKISLKYVTSELHELRIVY